VKTLNGFREVVGDRWYRAQLIEVLYRGPGAVALYFGVLSGLLSIGLSLAYIRGMVIASVGISSLMVLICLGFIIHDLCSCVRENGHRLITRAAQRSENRLRQLNLDAGVVLNFLREVQIAAGSFSEPDQKELVLAMVKALDCLSWIAIHYGSRGKFVIEKNLEPLTAMALLLLPDEENFGSAKFCSEIKGWLDKLPYYDPEGWALACAKCRQDSSLV